MTIIEPASAALDGFVRIAVLSLELVGTVTIVTGAGAAIFLFGSRGRSLGIQAV